MIRWSKKWFNKKRVDAIRRVLDELKKYRGGEIVAHKHPVHVAICSLEDLVDYKYRDGVRRNQLMQPVRGCWLAMLWASRNIRFPKFSINTLCKQVHWGSPKSTTSPRSPSLARQWKKRLMDELKVWLEKEPKEWEFRQKLIDCVTGDENASPKLLAKASRLSHLGLKADNRPPD